MLGVTVAKKGKIVFSAAASSADSGPTMGALHPGETILRIYSMTKPITSVAALILIGMLPKSFDNLFGYVLSCMSS